jgi:hypothetical protein
MASASTTTHGGHGGSVDGDHVSLCEAGVTAAGPTVEMLALRDGGHREPTPRTTWYLVERLNSPADDALPENGPIFEVLFGFAPTRKLLTRVFQLLLKVGDASTAAAYLLLGKFEASRKKIEMRAVGGSKTAIGEQTSNDGDRACDR